MVQTQGLSEGREIKFKFQISPSLATVALYLPEGSMVVKTFSADQVRQVVKELQSIETLFATRQDQKALNGFLASRFQTSTSFMISKLIVVGLEETTQPVPPARDAKPPSKPNAPWYTKPLFGKSPLTAKS